MENVKPILTKAGDPILKINGQAPLVDCRIVAEDYYQMMLRQRDKQLEALKEVSPLLDGLINRTPTGKKRNELCDMNIKVKTEIQNATQ